MSEKITLTIDKDKYVEGVQKLLLDRYAQGSIRSECDFIAGAAALFMLAEKMDKIPPMWVFGPMGNRPILGTSDTTEVFDKNTGKLSKVTNAMYDDAHKPFKGHDQSDDLQVLKTASHAFVRESSNETIELYLGITKKEGKEAIEEAWRAVS
jgi:hypothetical protein